MASKKEFLIFFRSLVCVKLRAGNEAEAIDKYVKGDWDFEDLEMIGEKEFESVQQA